MAGLGLAAAPALAMAETKYLKPDTRNLKLETRNLKLDSRPALLGGPKAFTGKFPSWPIYDSAEEQALLDVLHSGKWGRLDGDMTAKFEAEYARTMGAKHSLATINGTNALYTMLGALDVGPGDEVVIPVYTFVATYNVVVLNYALPILVDTDIESFQIDAQKMEKAITKQTKALMPVHIGGLPCDLDKVMEIAQRHKLPVIEDACQAPGTEWRGKKVGTIGLGGAFSFQSTKNLNCAEGGAIITNDSDFMQSCYAFHHQGQSANVAAYDAGKSGTRGTNARLTEFQASVLLAQMTRLDIQSRKRSRNADYLTKLFNEIPGITPAKIYAGANFCSYHLYMFRYDKAHFAGMSRARFIQAMIAEGVTPWAGYGQMNKDAYVTGLSQNRHYLKIYGEKAMKEWVDRNHCPQNDRLTSEESLWFGQNMLLGNTRDMDQIAEAVRKIQKNAQQLKS